MDNMGLFLSKYIMHFMPTPHAHPSCPPLMPTPQAHPSDHTSLPALAPIHTKPPCSIDSVLPISCHLFMQDFVCVNPRTHN